MLGSYNSTNSVARVADGTSNTVMFGEIVGEKITRNRAGGIPDGLGGASWTVGFNYSGFGSPEAGAVLNSWAILYCRVPSGPRRACGLTASPQHGFSDMLLSPPAFAFR
jgi:hypothetical protein